MRLTPPSRRSPTCCNKPAENGQSGRLCEKSAAFSISKGLNPSQSDTEMALPRKRHFTRAQARISRAQDPSLGHSAKGRISPRRPDRASFRDAVSSRFRLPRRARKMRPPRNDKFGRFCWKTKRFPERKASNFCGAILCKNNRKNEKRPFSKLKRSKFVSLRGRIAAVAIFKPKVWHPVAKHGSTKQEGSPIPKNMGFAASFCFLSLPSKVLFRSAHPYFVTG